jgi:hypothetical protein
MPSAPFDLAQRVLAELSPVLSRPLAPLPLETAEAVALAALEADRLGRLANSSMPQQIWAMGFLPGEGARALLASLAQARPWERDGSRLGDPAAVIVGCAILCNREERPVSALAQALCELAAAGFPLARALAWGREAVLDGVPILGMPEAVAFAERALLARAAAAEEKHSGEAARVRAPRL